MSDSDHGRAGEEQPSVRVTDKRRLDPESGEVRPGAGTPPAPVAGATAGATAEATEVASAAAAGSAHAGAVGSADASAAGTADASAAGTADASAAGTADASDEELGAMLSEAAGAGAELAERTEDLRRLKAEYDNYRRRVERDRAGWGELAVAKVISDLLPALDDVDRARAHGAIDGAFRAVADQVEKVVTTAGLSRFGGVGDAFDPARHEALTSVPTPDIEADQVLEVYRAGYEFAGRVLRAAQVVVGTPA